MNRDGLFSALVDARLGEGDIVYVERRGDEYGINVTGPGQDLAPVDPGAGFPDVWVYWSAKWPDDDPARQKLVFDDLLLEMESMAGGQPDRCRWDPNDPWPHSH